MSLRQEPKVPKGSSVIFGGSFNPVHNGHVALARILQEKYSFEPLWVVPALLPPHKTKLEASKEDRRKMVELAFDGIRGVRILPFELEREQTSYSIDTIEHLWATNPPQGRLYFILGEDAFTLLPSWHRASEVLQKCSFLVVPRKGSKPDGFAKTLALLKEKALLSPAQEILRLEVNLPEVSASDIRERLSRGKSVRGLVPERVAKYLETKRVYVNS